ncbi:MAG TPA: 16S rRNA (adenine(1518)-N(6)/adenine(1519)-N(6))-dimethyltransferase RsmA [Gemmatimonadaceae bacterium]
MSGDRDKRLPRPRKRFGQHFLADPRSLERIVEALAPEPTDTVVEIGPGQGVLTDLLIPRCGRLLAVEIDRDLVRHLKSRYEGQANVEVVEGDALETDWGAMAGGSYLLAGNLPYYITTPLIFRILTTPRPRRAVLLVQREVAARLAATPASKEYGALTVNVQVTASVRVVARVSAGAFRPRPSVDSAIVLLTPLEHPLLGADEEADFRRFVQAAFGMRRKQLLRVMRELWVHDASRASAILADVGLPAAARPEVVSPSDFVRLFRATTIRSDTAGRG